MPPRRGRPEALDESKREVVIALRAAGLSRAVAARYVGVTPATIRNTALRHPEFARRLIEAETELELAHLKRVSAAGGRSWRASAWALERLRPDRYGPRRPGTVSPRDVKAAVRALAAVLTELIDDDELLVRIQARLAKVVDELVDSPHAA